MRVPAKQYTSSDAETFKRRLAFAKEWVNRCQSNPSLPNADVFMTFYPIAKNIRSCSSWMAKNVVNNHYSRISSGSRVGEDTFWPQAWKLGSWFPWLWARGRISGEYNNQAGWDFYFDSFRASTPPLIESGPTERPPEDELVFYVYLACVLYTFRLNSTYQSMVDAYEKEMKWPVDDKVLAIQIRRGEITPKNGDFARDRPFFTVEQYVEQADIILKENPDMKYVYISTDSDDEIDKVRTLRPEWNLLYLPIDRSKFFRYGGSNGAFSDLERICALDTGRIPFVVDSALADLYFIARSHGYVSTIMPSEFSRCGWFLQFAFQQRMTPYVNMSGKDIDFNDRDVLLML
jgi:hypothetical protein